MCDRIWHGEGIRVQEQFRRRSRRLRRGRRAARGAQLHRRVRALLSVLAELRGQSVAGDLVSGASLSDSVVGLARARSMLDAEIGRRLVRALAADCLRGTPRTTLIADGGWSGSSAAAMIAAADFADRHDQVAQMWRSGAICLESVAVLARGLAPLPVDEQEHVVAGVLPHLPHLGVPALRRFVARAVDLLTPEDSGRREKRRHDQRFLAFSTFCGSLTFQGQLPELEGAAFQSAIKALAESLRAESDALTSGQRHADALITMVNRAAAHEDLPTTSGGLPVAASVTITLTEAERLLQTQAPAAGDSGATRDRCESSVADPAMLTGSDTTLGDAAARFVMCCADLTGVIVRSTADDKQASGVQAAVRTDSQPPGPVARALAATPLEPLVVGRATRFATRAQRTALAVRDCGCVIPGCQRPPGECQTHHVTEWARGGTTNLDTLALLCWAHHRQVDLNRWHWSATQTRSGPSGSSHRYDVMPGSNAESPDPTQGHGVPAAGDHAAGRRTIVAVSVR